MIIFVNARFLTQELTGVQRYAIEISKKIKEYLRENVVFVSPHNILQKGYARQIGAISIGRHRGHLWEQMDLPLYLHKHNNPILLNLCNTGPIFYKNKIVTLHDIAYIRYPESYSFKFKLFYRLAIPLILKSSKSIFTVSNFSRKEIISYYHIKAPKINVAYNSASDFWRKPERTSIDKFFLCVSSIKKNKNFILVLRAFSLLEKQGFDIPLYIIGSSSSKSFQDIDISFYENFHNIHFLGRVSDEELRGYYQKAIAFIFPSFYEGFGLPLIEAQSCGCPVLSSNRSCMKEILQDSALFFNPDDIDDLIEKIKMSLNRKRRMFLSFKGYENSKRFSWDYSALKYIDIITKI